MERISIRNTYIEGMQIDKLHVFLDDHGNLIILPMLWTLNLAITGCVFGWRKKRSFNHNKIFQAGGKSISERIFDANFISDNSIENYVGHVFHFLSFINKLYKEEGAPSVHNTELINSRLINHYLNNILPKRLNSVESLKSHQAAISSYFSFLYELEIKDVMPSVIYRMTHQLLAEKDCRPKKINYVSRSERSSLLQACTNDRDRLIIRMGYEVGLRSEENTGLVLGNGKAKGKACKGLLSIFDELEKYPNKNYFEFTLNGKYTKGGKTRNIYFYRELLSAMKRYYENERNSVIQRFQKPSNTLFIKTDYEGAGNSISAGHASNLFGNLRSRCPQINQLLSYHDLRHTFATELYHEELLDPGGQETRSESAALIVVSERLGHKNTSTTRRYIRLRLSISAQI